MTPNSGTKLPVRGDLCKVKLEIATGGTYNWIAAKNSVTKFKYVNADSNTFVNNCYAVAYDAPAVGDADNLPGMFCSEFVTVCYLLAVRKRILILVT